MGSTEGKKTAKGEEKLSMQAIDRFDGMYEIIGSFIYWMN